jgi:hypothetical protein
MTEVERFLRAVARELRSLGPIERSRALARIRHDVTELAIDGKAGPPDSGDFERALGEMPDPRRIAREYMRASRPPARLIRAASAACALLGLPTAGLMLFILSSGFLWVHPVFLAGLLVFLLCGLAVVAVYALAALAPARANRLRFAVLLPVAVCIFIDTLFVTAAMAFATELALLAILSPSAVFLGGAYCVSYVHGQLPRLARDIPPRAGDYFLVMGALLSDLDIVRRREILGELERHLESSGVSRDDYDSVSRVLGPPEDVAESYLRDVPARLPKKERGILAFLLLPAVLGVWLGGTILVWSLFSEVSVEGREHLTPLGLIGSIGLLVLSLTVIGLVMRMHRAPPKTADHWLPAIVLGIVGALIASATLGGVASGGILQSHVYLDYDIMASYVEDGERRVLWSETPCRHGDFHYDCQPVEIPTLRVTSFDDEIISTERVPWGPVSGDLHDFERYDRTWVALFSDDLRAWGTLNTGYSFGIPSSWESRGGRIDGRNASMAWTSESAISEDVTLIFRQLDWITGEETQWMRDFHMAGPGDKIRGVLMTPERVLVLRLTHENGENYSRSSLRGYLFDSSGSSIANMTLHEVNATAAGPGETESYIRISTLTEGEDFWIPIVAFHTSGGVKTVSSHLFRVEALTGNTTSWELHSEAFPVSTGPHTDGDLSLYVSQTLVLTEERAVVGSTWMFNVWRDPDTLEIDPSRGGRYVTSIAAGVLEYKARVADIHDLEVMHLLSVWGDSVSFLVTKAIGGDSLERTTMKAYHLTGSVPSIEVADIEVDLEAGWLLLWGSMLGGAGLGVAPGVSEFAGTSMTEDNGFLGWREHMPAFSSPTSESYARFPVIVRVDADKGEVVVIPLASPRYAPDTVAGLLITGVATFAAVAALHFAHRWMRVRGMRRQRQWVESSSSKQSESGD